MEPIEVALDAETREKLDRPVQGQGGFQDLLRLLQSCLSPEKPGVIRVERQETAERILRYYKKYGGGGFQERLQELAEAIESALGSS